MDVAVSEQALDDFRVCSDTDDDASECLRLWKPNGYKLNSGLESGKAFKEGLRLGQLIF